MFGINFIKVQPTEYVLLYRNGTLLREGAGLAFFYYGPTASIVRIPLASTDVPFIFNEVTSDFQEVTLQGQITYSVTDPKKLSQLMNFTLTSTGKDYTSDDPQKLPQRLINHVQVLTRTALKTMSLRQALGISADLITALRAGMQKAEETSSLGISILGLSILAVRPTPETARALEAEAREQILREADGAIYLRRNAAVEQERTIKENELNTEIAIENKKRQIRETQMDAEKAVQQKKRELSEAEMSTRIALEEKNQKLVSLASENAKLEADARAYGISAVMGALAKTDPKTLQALASVGMNPGQLVAVAFKELADNAEKIGQLNISPELLRELLGKGTTK
jgi:hypothetical protein